MLKIKTFECNMFAQNTYLVHNSTNAVLFDAGFYESYEFAELQEYLNGNNLTLDSIYLTHAHLDHVFGLDTIRNQYSISVYGHKLEDPVLISAHVIANNYGIGGMLPQNLPDFYLVDNQEIDILNEKVKVLFTPGHSPGSICFYFEEESFVISGDVLFQNSIGRTDLPGGSHEALIKSINEKLFPLPNNTKVYSGHGNPTTIEVEKKFNPFLT